MNAAERIENYIYNPFPLWDSGIAALVVEYKWDSYLQDTFRNRENYSINGCIVKEEAQIENTFPIPETDNKIQLALPTDNLSDFYRQHGLLPSFNDVSVNDKIEKIRSAMKVLGKIVPLNSFILELVRSVQTIESEDTETDISYSHPDIPFSIFFSLCKDNSVISDLRVAESILHESMHLLLTLIENFIDLIVPDSTATFYSPWRDEHRPVRGVLHGMFVFKSVKDFYTLLSNSFNASPDEQKYLKNRIKEIENEFSFLKDFPLSSGLTEMGKVLSSQILA